MLDARRVHPRRPKGPGGVEIRNCGASGADSTYCQDECGGRARCWSQLDARRGIRPAGYAGELSGVDHFKYRYYLTGKVSDLDSLPADPRPDSEAL